MKKGVIGALVLLLVLGSVAHAETLHVYWHIPSSRNMTGETVEAFLQSVGERIGVDVEVHFATGEPAVEAMFMLSTGVRLDVALYTHPDMVYNGMLEPLDEYIARDGNDILDQYILPVLMNSEWNYQGKLYALPTSRNHFVLVWNKDQFNMRGIAEPPSTWDESAGWTWEYITEIAPKLTRDRTGDGVPDYFGFSGMGWNLIWPGYYGIDFADENGNPTINTPEMRQVLQFFVDFVNSPFYGGTAPNDWYPAGVFENNAAMGLVGSWDYHAVAARSELDLAPSPMGTQFSTINFVDGMGIFATSQHKELAWRFIKEMASLETSTEFFLKGSGWTLPHKDGWMPLLDYRRSEFGDNVTEKHISIIFNAGNYGYIPRPFRDLRWRDIGWTQYIEGPLFDQVIPGTLPVASWLEEAQRIISNHLEQY
ncbi:MAG TPA: extracellular solute-binding protein [Limnochordia bacterium]|jgi:ABC-type sugar transport system, periplasmic component|nr:extracellular solute-binding protein [Limnochordia bacterium]